MIKTEFRIKNPLSLLVAAALAVQSLGCGTILHPERRGQRGGRLDAGIVVLNAVGLLFFVIPGVIAFAVDFSNGTIYLPGGGRGILSEVRFEKGGDSKAAVEAVILDRTGCRVKLDQPELEVVKLDSLAELPARFAAERVFTASRARHKARSS